MSTIKDRVRVVLQGDPVLSSQITRGWPLHGWTHEAGGIDEISIAGLSGLTADEQRAGWLETYEIDLSTAPTDGQVLMWDDANEVWYAATVDVEVTAGVTSLNGEDGDLYILGSAYIGVATSDPNITVSLLSHVVTHANGGSDELNVGGLSGLLADHQNAGWIDDYAVDLSTAPSSGDVLSWSGTAWIATPQSGGTPASLTESAVGYGSASDLLTGDATNFKYLAATRQMYVGDMTAGHLGSTNDSLGVLGDLEIDGVAYLDGGAQVASGQPVKMGPNTQLIYDTDQTVVSLVAWLHNGSHTLSIASLDDAGGDLGGAASTYPRLRVYGLSAPANPTRHLDFYHDGDDAFLRSYEGSLMFQEMNLGASTNWISNRQRLYSNVTEVDEIYALLGDNEGSIGAAILAASQIGGAGNTLDEAYDQGGAGAGKSVTVDAGSISFTCPPGSNNNVLTLSNQESTSTTELLNLYNVSAGRAMYIDGPTGTTDLTGDGHIIDLIGAATIRSTLGSVGDAYLHFSADTTSDYTDMTLIAQDDTEAEYAKLTLNSQEGAELRGSVGVGARMQCYAQKIELLGDGDIDCIGRFLGASQYLGWASSYVMGLSSNVLDADFSVATQTRYVNATQNINEVAVVDPGGVGIFRIRVKAVSGAISIQNFTSATSTPFTFIGNYDLNDSPLSIPSGEIAEVEMVYHGSTIGWDVKIVTQV